MQQWNGNNSGPSIGLYKTELIKRRGPRRSLDDVELTTAERAEWFNNQRIRSHLLRSTPAQRGIGSHTQEPLLNSRRFSGLHTR
jgi:putative transposase